MSFESVKIYFRSVIYSLSVVLGLYVASRSLAQFEYTGFLVFSASIGIIFFIELFTAWDFNNRLLQRKIKELDEYSLQSQILHHAVLPILLYISIVGYLFYNRQDIVVSFMLAFSFVVLTILFTHLHSLYSRNTKLFLETNYIYDLLKLFIIFIGADVLFNYFLIENNSLFVIILLTIAAVFFLYAMLVRYDSTDIKSLSLMALLSVIFFVTLVLFIATGTNPLTIATFTAISFYIIMATQHHIINNDLTIGLLVEYIAVLLFVFSFLSVLG